MYEYLIMIRPDVELLPTYMAALVREVCPARNVCTDHSSDVTVIGPDGGSLHIGLSKASHVILESREIAEKYGVDCAGCHARHEMSGDDPNMDLFNDHLLINERLLSTGKFVIFDQIQEELLADEGKDRISIPVPQKPWWRIW